MNKVLITALVFHKCPQKYILLSRPLMFYLYQEFSLKFWAKNLYLSVKELKVIFIHMPTASPAGKPFPWVLSLPPSGRGKLIIPPRQCFLKNLFSPRVERGGDYKDFTRSTRGCIVLSLHSSEILSLLMILVLGLQWRYTEIINLSPFL